VCEPTTTTGESPASRAAARVRSSRVSPPSMSVALSRPSRLARPPASTIAATAFVPVGPRGEAASGGVSSRGGNVPPPRDGGGGGVGRDPGSPPGSLAGARPVTRLAAGLCDDAGGLDRGRLVEALHHVD